MLCCWFIFSALRVAMSVWRLLNISAMFCNNDVICGSISSRADRCGLDSRDGWVVDCECVAPLSELVGCSVVQVTLVQM